MPDTFLIERSTLVDAPAEAIYPFVEDFRRWRDWSPFEGIDPNLKRSFSGAERGIGAGYAWEGNAKAGAGSMEIVDAAAPGRIGIKLDFQKPMRASHKATFTFAPEGAATRVTWSMKGRRPLAMKLMGLLMDFDKLVGRDFEKGLAKLKTLAEDTPRS